MEENSFSIINRTNGQITGQTANALPIKLVASLSWVKIFIAGFIFAFVFMIIFILNIKSQVVSVQISGKSPDFQEYKIK